MLESIKEFSEKVKEFNISLNNIQIKQFRVYYEFLKECNRNFNLVSSAEFNDIFTKHFLDSLSIAKIKNIVDLNTSLQIVDVGAGAGFPGVPVLIAFSHIKLYTIDSVIKKNRFIKELSNKIGLSDRIEVITGRAEEVSRDVNMREFFDLATIRAVARLNITAEYCIPFLKVGGFFVAYKAKTAQEEISEAYNAINLLGGRLHGTIDYTLTGQEERTLVLIEKISSTPEKYPRKTGMPFKKPII